MKLAQLLVQHESRLTPWLVIKKISYEAARDELAEVVTALEVGGATLEESLKLWERGEELAKICQEWLDGARAKLEKIKPQS